MFNETYNNESVQKKHNAALQSYSLPQQNQEITFTVEEFVDRVNQKIMICEDDQITKDKNGKLNQPLSHLKSVSNDLITFDPVDSIIVKTDPEILKTDPEILNEHDMLVSRLMNRNYIQKTAITNFVTRK